MYYKLDENRNPVPIEDVLEWATVFAENPDMKNVAKDDIDGHHISTVFLGLDHSWGDGPPVLFETMVFSGDADYDQFQDRYTTWDEAQLGHIFVCNCIRMKQPLNNRKILKIKL